MDNAEKLICKTGRRHFSVHCVGKFWVTLWDVNRFFCCCCCCWVCVCLREHEQCDAVQSSGGVWCVVWCGKHNSIEIAKFNFLVEMFIEYVKVDSWKIHASTVYCSYLKRKLMENRNHEQNPNNPMWLTFPFIHIFFFC